MYFCCATMDSSLFGSFCIAGYLRHPGGTFDAALACGRRASSHRVTYAFGDKHHHKDGYALQEFLS